jgi:DNA processing protein
LISGLSLGVVVTEATLNSGSLITAGLAADQGREVFALPGSVASATSRGPNGLIKEGATLVESADDIIAELLPQLDESFRTTLRNRDSTSDSLRRFGKEEALVYDALSREPQQVDSVIEKTGLSASAVATVLMTLELKNCVRHLPGNIYLRL